MQESIRLFLKSQLVLYICFRILVGRGSFFFSASSQNTNLCPIRVGLRDDEPAFFTVPIWIAVGATDEFLEER